MKVGSYLERALGLTSIVAVLLLTAVAAQDATATVSAEVGGSDAAEAAEFLESAEAQLASLLEDLGRAQWVQQTYITEDTEILAAKANERYIGAVVELAKEAARFDLAAMPYDTARRLKRLKLTLSLPAPANEAETAELSQIAAWLESAYSRGEYCPEGGECMDLVELSRVIASSRDAEELLEVWEGWRTISPPMKEKYARLVELANKGARELGCSSRFVRFTRLSTVMFGRV